MDSWQTGRREPCGNGVCRQCILGRVSHIVPFPDRSVSPDAGSIHHVQHHTRHGRQAAWGLEERCLSCYAAGGTWHACIIDVGLCTLAAYPRVCNLTEEQEERFYWFHSHIAMELVEVGALETQLSDIFQLGMVLQNRGEPELVRSGDWCGRRDPQCRPSTTVLRLMITSLTH